MDKIIFQLHCERCGAEYEAEELVPGKIPLCNCGSTLTAPGELVFYCADCGLESEPEPAPIDQAVLCPECLKPMPATRQILPPVPPVQPNFPEAIPPEKTITLTEGRRAELRVATDRSLQGIKREFFGKYRIVRELARGGMGIVYHVRDEELRRDLALKVMLQGEGATELAIKRFMREARAAANLKHPGIITVHEMGMIDGQHYFTMDLIDGKSFQEIFRDQERMPEKALVSAMRDACAALQVAHDNNIIHRDLKPANIMLEKNTGRVVLMDFGLAKDSSSMSIQSITGAVFGSPAYMSPEQAQGMTHQIDGRSDIYSMGVMLYEGLTGQKPFYGESALETISLLLNTEPPSPHRIAPGSVSKDMENIILKCLEKHPDRRYQSMSLLQADLDAYLRGDPVSARPIPWHMRMGRKIRRRPVLLGMLAASPLIIAAGLAAWLIFGGHSYLEIATEAIKSGEAVRQAGAVRELVARLEKEQIRKPEQRAKAFHLLTKCYNAPQADTALAAINASARFQDAQSLPLLLDVAADPSRPDKVRLAAISAAGIIEAKCKISKPEHAMILVGIGSDASAPLAVRQAALRALKDFNSAALLGEVLALAENRQLQPTLRAVAVETLGEQMTIVNPMMKNMLNLYADESPEVARAAANALAKIRQGEALFGIYGMKAAGRAYGQIADIKSKEAERNRAMMELIDDNPGDRKTKETSPLELIAAKLKDGDAATRAAAAYDLQVLGDPKAVPVLLKLLEDSDNQLRRVAARSIISLAEKDQTADLRPVQALLRQKDPLIRELAAYIFGELRYRSAVPVIAAAAENEDSQRVQLEIIRALTRIGDPAGLPALETICRRNLENRPNLAAAAIEAMEKFGAAAIPFLVRQLENQPPPELRDLVIDRLKEITGEDFGTDKQRWLDWKPNSKAP